MDGLDPCSLLTKAQQQRLGTNIVDRAKKPDDLGNLPCEFVHFPDRPNYTYDVNLVPQRGAEYFLSSSSVRATPRVAFAAGFPVVLGHIVDDNRACFADVDVASGQSLSVQYSYNSYPLPADLTIDEICERARMGAELAVQTLKTLRP